MSRSSKKFKECSPKKLKNVVCNGTRVPQFCFVVFLEIFFYCNRNASQNSEFHIETSVLWVCLWKLGYHGSVTSHSRKQTLKSPTWINTGTAGGGVAMRASWRFKSNVGQSLLKKIRLTQSYINPLKPGLSFVPESAGWTGGPLPSTLSSLVTSGPFKLQR